LDKKEERDEENRKGKETRKVEKKRIIKGYKK